MKGKYGKEGGEKEAGKTTLMIFEGMFLRSHFIFMYMRLQTMHICVSVYTYIYGLNNIMPLGLVTLHSRAID